MYTIGVPRNSHAERVVEKHSEEMVGYGEGQEGQEEENAPIADARFYTVKKNYVFNFFLFLLFFCFVMPMLLYSRCRFRTDFHCTSYEKQTGFHREKS